MQFENEHTNIWLAISTAAGTAAVTLFRMGQQWGTILTLVQEMRENQQAIADHLKIILPHPYVAKVNDGGNS